MRTQQQTSEVLPTGTFVRHADSIMEGVVRGRVNPARVAGRTDCVWVFWSWGRTPEISSELEVIP